MHATDPAAAAPARSPAGSWGDLTRASARQLALLAGLNGLAALLYVAVAMRVGFFGHVGAALFWSPDSHSYRDVADWLFGGPNSYETIHRPFLYPLLLGASRHIGGDWGVWGLNLVCWFATLNLSAVGAWRMTGRFVAGAVVFLVLATNLSIVALTFQALTEPLTLALESAWIAGLAWSRLPPERPLDFVLLLMPLTLLAVVKPGYQLETAAGLGLLGLILLRTKHRRLVCAAAIAACCVPIGLQLALNATANHFAGLSSTGQLELKDYYFAQVYASLNGLPIDLTQARSDVAPFTTSQMLAYLLEHKQAAIRILLDNLRGNLSSPSPFIDASSNPALAAFAHNMNRAYERLHLLFVPIVALAIWRRCDPRLTLLYLFAAVLILMPSLIYDQGDRYIQMAAPLWSAAYALAVFALLPDIHKARSALHRTSQQGSPTMS